VIWTYEKIVSLKEDQLCKDILIPLFNAMEFQDVYHYHGGLLEQGKDIVMWKEEALCGRMNYAVVVKAEKISGEANKITRLVLTQVQQCFGSPYLDKITREERHIYHCFIVTSKEITKEAIYSLKSALRAMSHDSHVTFIDGEKLWKYIKKYLPQYIIFESFVSGYEALNSADPYWEYDVQIKQKEVRFNLEPKNQEDGPVELMLNMHFLETLEDKKKQAEFQQFIETGSPVKLDSSNIEVIEISKNLPFPLMVADKYQLILGPTRQREPRLFSIEIIGNNGGNFFLPYIDFVVTQIGTEQITFSNDKQPIPFKFIVTYSKKTSHMVINYHFDAIEHNIYQLAQILKAQRLIAEGCSIFFTDLETGQRIPCPFVVPFNGADLPDKLFVEMVDKVVFIQEQTKTLIPVPDKKLLFTQQDIFLINQVETILKTGVMTTPLESLTLATQKDPKKIQEVLESKELFLKMDFRDILGTQVPLGPITIQCDHFEVHPQDTKAVQSALSENSTDEQLTFRLMPAKGSTIEVKYLQWLSPT
jgi:hypothetical protein